MRTVSEALISFQGSIDAITTDDAYRFVTVRFPSLEARQDAVLALPQGTSWDRGEGATLTLHLSLDGEDPSEVLARPYRVRVRNRRRPSQSWVKAFRNASEAAEHMYQAMFKLCDMDVTATRPARRGGREWASLAAMRATARREISQ